MWNNLAECPREQTPQKGVDMDVRVCAIALESTYDSHHRWGGSGKGATGTRPRAPGPGQSNLQWIVSGLINPTVERNRYVGTPEWGLHWLAKLCNTQPGSTFSILIILTETGGFGASFLFSPDPSVGLLYGCLN